MLEWTLGETSIESTVYNSEMLTAGYHQPVLKVFPSEEAQPVNYDFTIAPNPVISSLEFRSFSLENSPIGIILTDLNGKQISFTKATTNDTKNIEMSNLKAGIYLLNIKDQHGVNLRTFRVVKTH